MSKTALAILGFCGHIMEEPPRTAQPPQANQADKWLLRTQIHEKLKHALNWFHRAVEDNHGIKEHNILRLLLPIGIEVSQLDPLWITEMDSYGAARGLVAHKGVVRCSAQQQVDPASEAQAVASLLKGIEDLDEKFVALMRRLH